jgi:hypothetical protein
MKRQGAREANEFNMGEWRMNGKRFMVKTVDLEMSIGNSPSCLLEGLNFLNYVTVIQMSIHHFLNHELGNFMFFQVLISTDSNKDHSLENL